MPVRFPPPQASSASRASTLTSTGHAPQLSMAVLQQTCAYTSTPFQALTSSTIPSSSHGEETLDQGDSSRRWVQIDEVFTRLPASPLTPAHHPLGPHLNGPENCHHPSEAGNHCRVARTITSYTSSVCTADPIGKACPVYYGRATALFF